MVIPIYIEPDKKFTQPIKYTLQIFAINKNIPVEFCNDKNENTFMISDINESDVVVSEKFYSDVEKKIFPHEEHLNKSCMIQTNHGEDDYLATAFYMMNCCQEYNAKKTDELGRFKYEDSYQYKFNNAHVNLVQQCFDEIAKHPKFSSYKNTPIRSKIFLSHDIDFVNEGMKEEIISTLKAGDFGIFFKQLLYLLIQKPYWLNIDKIMKLENSFDFKSTFYWMVNKGKINHREANADYDINSKSIREMMNEVKKNNFENGIHRSISSDSFQDEIHKLGFKPLSNRYHYLKFSLPEAFDQIELSDIPLDTSIGFPEMYGFRNSYGLPFQPYNFTTKKSYSFIEMPLHIMDRTFYSYLNEKPVNVADKIISFFEKNKCHCILSVLWHNNFFSGYTFNGYPQVFRKLLEYFYESKFDCITPQEIIKGYRI